MESLEIIAKRLGSQKTSFVQQAGEFAALATAKRDALAEVWNIWCKHIDVTSILPFPVQRRQREIREELQFADDDVKTADATVAILNGPPHEDDTILVLEVSTDEAMSMSDLTLGVMVELKQTDPTIDDSQLVQADFHLWDDEFYTNDGPVSFLLKCWGKPQAMQVRLAF